jgi:hypothetical protein
METTPEDNSNTLLKSIVDKQRVLIDRQNERISAYLCIIDMFGTLCKAKNVAVPIDIIAELLQAKNADERDCVILQFKAKMIHEVLDEFEEELKQYEDEQQEAPEWDNGVYHPKDEIKSQDDDITKWKTFSRKWRLFGDGN